MMTEHAEFLAERESEWHWYKPNKIFDNEASLFEAIDVIHFMLAAILYRYELWKVEKEINSIVFDFDELDRWYSYYDEYAELNNILSIFNTKIVDDYFILEELIGIISCYFIVISRITGYAYDDIYNAYILKNDLNLNRVKNGVMEGKYDKNKEEQLCLNN